MNKSENIESLAEALSKMQGEMKPAVKDETNPFFRSRYADLASVWEACRKPLADNGLSVMQIPGNSEDGKISIETILLHKTGQWMSSVLSAKPVKDDPQAVGSLITYLRRYALSSMLGVSAEDDDGNEASGKVPQKEAVKPPVSSSTPVQAAKPAVASPSASTEVVNVGVDTEWLKEQFLKMPSPWSAGTCMSWMEFQFRIKRGKSLEETIASLTQEQKEKLVNHVTLAAGAK